MFRKSLSLLRLPRRGTVAAVLALSFPLLIGVAALALDGGLLYLQRRQAQSTADSGALAGAYALSKVPVSARPRARPSPSVHNSEFRSCRLRSLNHKRDRCRLQ